MKNKILEFIVITVIASLFVAIMIDYNKYKEKQHNKYNTTLIKQKVNNE